MGSLPQPPRNHRLFSYLPWSLGTIGGDELRENEGGDVDVDGDQNWDMRLPGGKRGEEGNGWLEENDIEEVE